MKNLPTISIVMPVYNEERNISRCLQAIREQDYPQDRIEIVIVDDNSTDRTVEIAKNYDVKIAMNGKRDYDTGKSIGIINSSNEYILFLDADNFLPTKDWLNRLVEPIMIEKNLVGAQPIWFTYNRKYPLADRYATLFGITDPLTIYLKKRDRLMLSEDKWNLVKNIVEKNNYFLATFNLKNLPTIGSVGFIIRKELLLKTNYKPSFSHLDCISDLVMQNHNKFAMVKLDIIHLHSRTIKEFFGKLRRNMQIFLRDYNVRRYKWESTKSELFFAVLVMLTFVVPFYHSIKGYKKIKDSAWFLHPYICFRLVIMYSIMMLKWRIKNFNLSFP